MRHKVNLSCQNCIFYEMRFSFYSLLLLFCLAQISFAQESPARRTFSLGSRGIWSESGLVVTSGSGLFHRSGCKGSFYQVHLALDYLYQPWFSGGAEVRITGGVDDAENAFAFNRYYLRARFFQEQGNFLLFASPLIGMDQGYSDLFYIQEDGLRPEGTGEECLELNDDPTVVLGIEGGSAWKPHPLWNFSLAFSLQKEFPNNPFFGLSGAAALDLAEAAPSLQKTVSAFYLFLEMNWVYRKKGGEYAPSLGLSIAF